MSGLVERLQEGLRRPRMRQTNFWISDDLNERLIGAVAHFGAGSKSHLARVLLEAGLERLYGGAEGESPSGAWSVDVKTEYETARLIVLAEEKGEAIAVLKEWLDGQPAAHFDADAMKPHDGAGVLFMSRDPGGMDDAAGDRGALESGRVSGPDGQ